MNLPPEKQTLTYAALILTGLLWIFYPIGYSLNFALLFAVIFYAVVQVLPLQSSGDSFFADSFYPSNQEYVFVIASYNQLEIEIWKHFLFYHDIHSYSIDDCIGSYQYYYAHPIGGIKLYVPAENASEALQLIQFGLSEDELETPPMRCPKCSSLWILFEGSASSIAIASMVFLQFAFPFKRRKNRCLQCGQRWTYNEA